MNTKAQRVQNVKRKKKKKKKRKLTKKKKKKKKGVVNYFSCNVARDARMSESREFIGSALVEERETARSQWKMATGTRQNGAPNHSVESEPRKRETRARRLFGTKSNAGGERTKVVCDRRLPTTGNVSLSLTVSLSSLGQIVRDPDAAT